MLTGWTNYNAKKFKEVYQKVLGKLPDSEPLDLELFHEFEKQAISSSSGGGGHSRYENRTKEELYQLAQEKKIEGRSSMNKDELIKALREH